MTGRNIVLVCLDTVREDYFRRHATRLQARADIVYRECRAASSWSAPSHASMLTGTLPSEHGVHAYHRDFSGLSRADTFLADLPDHRAVGASANVWASSAFGFDGLFDELSDISPDRRFPEGIDVARFGQRCERDGVGKHLAFLRESLAHDRPLLSLANGALVELDNLLARAPVPKPIDDGASTIVREALRQVGGEEPFFQFVNFMDAHGPLRHVLGYDRSLHDAPLAWSSETVDWQDAVTAGDDELLERYRDLYAASIDYLDRTVCEFIDRVQAAADRETTFVVTADHGDNLAYDADKGLWGHTESSLSEGLLHVPCVVVNAPGSGSREVDEYLSHLRLGDLLVGLAGGERPSVSEPRIPAERVGHSGKVHKIEGVDPAANRAVRCVYEGDRKHQWDSAGERAVYRLDPERPCWQEAVDESFEVERLESAFFDEPVAEYRERAAGADEGEEAMDDVTRDRLEDLGYL